MPIENEPPQFFAGEPIRADDLNKLGEGYAYLQRYFGDRLVEVGGQPGRLPEIVEVFPALVKKASDYSTTNRPLTEPTDARYYLARGIPKLSLAAGALFDAQADDFTAGPAPTYLVGTNLAELSGYTTTATDGTVTQNVAGTHLLRTDGTLRVVALAFSYRHDPLKKQYVFWQPPAGLVLVKITGAASGGGKYTGRTVAPPTSNVPATGNLSAAELGTAASADDCLVLNMQEIGTSHHDLTNASNTNQKYFTGQIIRKNNVTTGSGNASDGLLVVAINGGWDEDC